MTTTNVSTRRSFISVAGAALSVPVAAAAVSLPLHAAEDGDPLATRLARFEDLHAIQELNRSFARHLNAGAREELAGLFADPSEASVDAGLRGIAAEGLGEHDVIDVAADGRTATARLHCSVQRETVIGPECPLVEMARAQGGGVVRSSESAVFEMAYVKQGGAWKIERFGGRSVRLQPDQEKGSRHWESG